jgi:hypothetical protein
MRKSTFRHIVLTPRKYRTKRVQGNAHKCPGIHLQVAFKGTPLYGLEVWYRRLHICYFCSRAWISLILNNALGNLLNRNEKAEKGKHFSRHFHMAYL